MHCQNFLKVHKNTGEKIFAKYFSADGCFVKTNTINIVMITTTLSVSLYQGVFFYQAAHETKFHLKYQSDPFAQQLGLSMSTKVLICKKLKMNLRITPTDTSFCKYQDHAKILIVFKKWCNCLILCEIIFQLGILRNSVKKSV